MYLYVYDSFLSHQKYAPLITAIERRVADLDIKGRVARLSVLKNTQELLRDAVKAGTSTIVAIGDDETFAKIINIVANLDVTLGLIPADGKSKTARVLGIPPRELACDVLAARIIKKLDLGKINNYFFLSSAEISNADVRITCNGYSVQPTTKLNSVRICNVGWDSDSVSNPTDGVLEAIITPIEERWLMKHQLQPTVLPFTKIRISAGDGGGVPILTDTQTMLKTPAVVEIAPHKLRIIVGMRRRFL